MRLDCTCAFSVYSSKSDMLIVPIIKPINWNMGPHHVQLYFYRQILDWTWSPVSRLIQLIIQLSFNNSIKNFNCFQGLILGMHWGIILPSTQLLTKCGWLNVKMVSKSRSMPKHCESWLTFLLERCMNKSTLSGAIGLPKKGNEWAWMELQCQTSCPAIIFFLSFFFFFFSPSLGKGHKEMSDQRATKDLRKNYINLLCLNQLVGCIIQATSAVFVLPLILPPPPHTHTQMLCLKTSLP